MERGGTIQQTKEVIHTSETGGQKGLKQERFDLVPANPLEEVARVYGFGASKYSDNNWRKGYPWGWSLGACLRHISAFRRGEDRDPESGLHHLAHAAFHLLALMEFQATGTGTDDRADKRDSV